MLTLTILALTARRATAPPQEEEFDEEQNQAAHRRGRSAARAGRRRWLGTAEKASAAESLSVNLASVTGPATSVGEGFLYGVSQDGTQPSDQYLQPLGITAFRGGGHVSGGWIGDGYQNGSGTQADVNTVIAQARRLTQGSYHAQYQVILSDIFGADGGQPSNTTYPCTNGNCSNWVTFVGDVVSELQATGLPFAYDIYNEPDISVFWPGGAQTSQYYQMWQSAYKEIRSVAPNATIVGPDFAYTPQQNQGEWQGFLSNAKSSGTVPTEITNHEEGDGDDPVADSNAIESAISAAGISPAPKLSANEYQPADRQTAGVTAWYLARFAQSKYFNAMRGNWVCCLTPNLAGVLTSVGRQLPAERQLVGDARLRRHDRFPGVHLRPVRVHRDLGGRGQLGQALGGHHR